MMRRGFTVIELVIVITIMGVLLALAVVNLTATQANARDSERKADVESVAIMFEAYYRNASNESTSSPGTYVGKVYPSTDVISNASTFKTAFPDADPKIVRAPNVAETSPMSLTVALSNTTDTNLLSPRPAASSDTYVYQPLRGDGSLCTTFSEANPCQKFNLYYFQETSGTVEIITSKNQ